MQLQQRGALVLEDWRLASLLLVPKKLDIRQRVMRHHVSCAISIAIALFIAVTGCKGQQPPKSKSSIVRPPPAQAPEQSKPSSRGPKINKAKIWEQLLALGHLPLASMQHCDTQAGDKRTLFTYLSRVLGDMGGGMPRSKAKMATPQAGYTLHFECAPNRPKDNTWNCKINTNDLASTGRLYFGLQFQVELPSHRIPTESLACD